MSKDLVCTCQMACHLAVFIGWATITIICGADYGQTKLYGCYVGNGADICTDWNEKVVSYHDYKDVVAYAPENCNCNKCVDSVSCDCSALNCYLIGQYDVDSQCIIVHDYKFYGGERDATSYNSIWNYKKLNTTYEFGKYETYYTNDKKFPGYCMPVADVENIGNYAYSNMFMIILGSILSTVYFLNFCFVVKQQEAQNI